MINKIYELVVIDFDRDDYGDPWEEFNRLVWSIQVSYEFATGIVDGYFNKKIPDDVLLSCAKLAKRFSKAQNNAKIPIIYTERKYVKKANSKIAFVTYKNEKEIYC